MPRSQDAAHLDRILTALPQIVLTVPSLKKRTIAIHTSGGFLTPTTCDVLWLIATLALKSEQAGEVRFCAEDDVRGILWEDAGNVNRSIRELKKAECIVERWVSGKQGFELTNEGMKIWQTIKAERIGLARDLLTYLKKHQQEHLLDCLDELAAAFANMNIGR